MVFWNVAALFLSFDSSHSPSIVTHAVAAAAAMMRLLKISSSVVVEDCTHQVQEIARWDLYDTRFR